MTINEQIVRSRALKGMKVMQLFAVVMTNYRQPLGDDAWDKMAQVIGQEESQAFAFLACFLIGQHGSPDHEKWKQWLPKLRKPRKRK